MNAVVTGGAVPFKRVDRSGGARAFDYEADAAGNRTLRRVPHVRRQKKDIAFIDRHVARFAVVHDAQRDVAANLIEELFERIVVIIGAAVRPADDRDDEVGIAPDLRVSDRRTQHFLVFVDPSHEVDRSDLSAIFSSALEWYHGDLGRT